MAEQRDVTALESQGRSSSTLKFDYGAGEGSRPCLEVDYGRP